MKILILLICSFSIFLDTSAQTKTESIDLLFHLTKKDSMVELNMKKLMESPQFSAFAGKNVALSGSDSIMLAKRIEYIKSLYRKILIEEKVLYDKHFIHTEILEMIAFYQSPTGLKMVNETNLIQTELQKIIMEKYASEMVQQMMNTKK
jgi:hypothetical protein